MNSTTLFLQVQLKNNYISTTFNGKRNKWTLHQKIRCWRHIRLSNIRFKNKRFWMAPSDWLLAHLSRAHSLSLCPYYHTMGQGRRKETLLCILQYITHMPVKVEQRQMTRLSGLLSWSRQGQYYTWFHSTVFWNRTFLIRDTSMASMVERKHAILLNTYSGNPVQDGSGMKIWCYKM